LPPNDATTTARARFTFAQAKATAKLLNWLATLAANIYTGILTHSHTPAYGQKHILNVCFGNEFGNFCTAEEGKPGESEEKWQSEARDSRQHLKVICQQIIGKSQLRRRNN